MIEAPASHGHALGSLTRNTARLNSMSLGLCKEFPVIVFWVGLLLLVHVNFQLLSQNDPALPVT